MRRPYAGSLGRARISLRRSHHLSNWRAQSKLRETFMASTSTWCVSSPCVEAVLPKTSSSSLATSLTGESKVLNRSVSFLPTKSNIQTWSSSLEEITSATRSQECMVFTMSVKEDTICRSGEISAPCSTICLYQLSLMREYCVCMEVCHQIFNTYHKLMLCRDRKMFPTLVFYAIFFGLTLMTSRVGEIMIEVSLSFLARTSSKSSAKSMT